jgi:hypothetical protein
MFPVKRSNFLVAVELARYKADHHGNLVLNDVPIHDIPYVEFTPYLDPKMTDPHKTYKLVLQSAVLHAGPKELAKAQFVSYSYEKEARFIHNTEWIPSVKRLDRFSEEDQMMLRNRAILLFYALLEL